jgi:hypothetical protein
MEPKGFQRSLAALLYADEVRFCSPTQDDQSPPSSLSKPTGGYSQITSRSTGAGLRTRRAATRWSSAPVVAGAPSIPPKTGPEPVRAVRHHLVPYPGRGGVESTPA